MAIGSQVATTTAVLDNVLEPLARDKRLSDRVADAVLDLIYRCGQVSGDPLPSERQLAERLRVSRSVVREAVRELSARGFVAVRPGIGLVVAEVTASSASETLGRFVRGSRDVQVNHVREVRRCLETEIAELAAKRGTDEGIELLRTAFERQRDGVGDLEESALADLEFHQILAQLTRNALFPVVLEALRETLLDIRREAIALPGNLEKGIEAHARILDAVAARDPGRARHEMVEHLAISDREFFGPRGHAEDSAPSAAVSPTVGSGGAQELARETGRA